MLMGSKSCTTKLKLKNTESCYNELWLFVSAVVIQTIPTDVRLILARKFKDEIWALDEMLEIIQQELAAKERCSIEISFNYNAEQEEG